MSVTPARTPAETALAEALAVRGRSAPAFDALGLPHRRVEAWKWTDMRARVRDALGPASQTAEVAPVDLGLDVAPHEIVIVNGRLATSQLGEGVRVFVSEDATPPARDGEDAVVSLAGALAPHAVVIEIDGALAAPIHLRHVASGEGARHGRTAIVLRDGARAHVVESFEGAPPGLANDLIEVGLQGGARLTRTTLQTDAAPDLARVVTTDVTMKPGCAFEDVTLALGGRLTRLETRVAHPGEGAHVQLNGAYVVADQRHVDITTVVTHEGPGGTTEQLFKGAAAGKATGVFQGLIHVERAAQKTDARMGHHALLLTEGARVNAKPELEIFADDVACAHGNTIGALDPMQLFYMRARGVPEARARAVLTQAFLADALNAIAREDVRDLAQARLADALAGV